MSLAPTHTVKTNIKIKETFTYTSGSLINIMTDPNGNRIEHYFNSDGRIVEEVDGLGGSYRFLRNVTGDETFYTTILAEGETSTSKDSTLANGDTQNTMTLATGENIEITLDKNDKKTKVVKDGVTTVSYYVIDIETHKKVLAQKEITMPSGLKSVTQYNTLYVTDTTHVQNKTQKSIKNSKTTTIHTDYDVGDLHEEEGDKDETDLFNNRVGRNINNDSCVNGCIAAWKNGKLK